MANPWSAYAYKLSAKNRLLMVALSSVHHDVFNKSL